MHTPRRLLMIPRLLPSAVLALTLLATACGDSGDDSGGGGSSGSFGQNPFGNPDAGDTTEDMTTPDTAEDMAVDLSPQVTITTPESSSGLASDTILQTPRFTVVCRVEANPMSSDGINTDSIKITVMGLPDTPTADLLEEKPAMANGAQNEFTADFDLSAVPNGPIDITCQAEDNADTPRVSTDTNGTFLDQGPVVRIITPADGNAYANQLMIEVSITSAPLDSTDTEAGIGQVQFFLSGIDISADITEAEPGVYRGTILFDDPRFAPGLTGEREFRVTASNQRMPTPVSRARSSVFLADNAGPTITIAAPTPGQIVGGIFDVKAEVTDNAGVDQQSVVASISGSDPLTLVLGMDGFYSGRFDSRELGTDLVFPTLSVRAKDQVGNQSSVGQQITLDARPPLSSLDPPMVREGRIRNGVLQCSVAFDPVGNTAINDGQAIPQLSQIRARVQDIGNGGLSQTPGIVIPVASVDPQGVQLYVLDDTSIPLIVDTNGDGFCDSINPLVQPSSVPDPNNPIEEAVVIDMVPVGPSGTSFFSDAQMMTDFVDAPSCNPGDVSNEPDPICPAASNDLQRLITSFSAGMIPAIYTLPPVENNVRCLGNAFDSLASNISDGWVCMTVRSRDNLGNVSVSPPLRACIDSDQNGAENCLASGNIHPEADRPNCTGTYNMATNTTTNQPCQIAATFSNLTPPGITEVIRIDL